MKLRHLNPDLDTSILLEVPNFCDTSMRYYLTAVSYLILKIFARGARKPQNFRLRRAKISKFLPVAGQNLKFSPAAHPNLQISSAARQNLKISAAAC